MINNHYQVKDFYSSHYCAVLPFFFYNTQLIMNSFIIPSMLSVSSMQFSESWQLLMDWMTEVEQTLDTHKEIAVSHEEIKQQLTEQKVK